MKPIRILSPMLDLQGEIDNYLSLSFCRSYHFPGEFQLVINRKVQNVDKLKINQIIMLARSGFSNHPLFPHPPRKNDLPHSVVDLMCPGMV
jgi:hypothetical protein